MQLKRSGEFRADQKTFEQNVRATLMPIADQRENLIVVVEVIDAATCVSLVVPQDDQGLVTRTFTHSVPIRLTTSFPKELDNVVLRETLDCVSDQRAFARAGRTGNIHDHLESPL
jgi:hypothetical protein